MSQASIIETNTRHSSRCLLAYSSHNEYASLFLSSTRLSRLLFTTSLEHHHNEQHRRKTKTRSPPTDGGGVLPRVSTSPPRLRSTQSDRLFNCLQTGMHYLRSPRNIPRDKNLVLYRYLDLRHIFFSCSLGETTSDQCQRWRNSSSTFIHTETRLCPLYTLWHSQERSRPRLRIHRTSASIFSAFLLSCSPTFRLMHLPIYSDIQMCQRRRFSSHIAPIFVRPSDGDVYVSRGRTRRRVEENENIYFFVSSPSDAYRFDVH